MEKRRIFLVVLTAGMLISFAYAAEQQPTSPPTTTTNTAAPSTATQTPAASTSTQATADAATTGPKSGMDNFRDWFHNPTDWMSQGLDLRVRYTYGYNLDTLNDNGNRENKWNWYQNRTRYWQKYKLTDDVDFNMREVWEFRVWDSPARKNGNGTATEVRTHGTDFSEIVFDQFNLTMRNFADMPLTFVAGRQDIMFGEGWLVMDGTPLDAARTMFFDALRFTYQIPDREATTLDLIYIENRGDEGAYLQPINDRKRYAADADERGIIAYLTDKSNPNMNVEGYFIFKNDNPLDVLIGDNPRGPTGYDRFPPFWSRKARIYTFGGALSGAFFGSEHWKYRSEGAIQTGEKDGMAQAVSHASTGMQNLMAYGTVNKLEYHFNDVKKNKLRGAFEFLSGDQPNTGKIEAFDPLWGHWPRISEILAYTYTLETEIAEVTNLWRLGLGHSIQLTDKLSLDTDVHWLWANHNSEENRNRPGVIGWSDDGKYRGTLGTSMLKYKLTKNLNMHFLFEYFQPGSYYLSGNRDAAYFTRINMDYTF